MFRPIKENNNENGERKMQTLWLFSNTFTIITNNKEKTIMGEHAWNNQNKLKAIIE